MERRTAKTAQLQLRVTPEEKRQIAERAAAAGSDMSGWVLERLLPKERETFQGLVAAVRPDQRSFALAELNTFLERCSATAFLQATAEAPRRALEPLEANHVAAMVEVAAQQKRVAPPPWTRDVGPLATPYFATSLRSLAPYLLRVSPVAFRRRNLFVDATVGDQV